jgi:hypothetical protein
MVISVVMVVMVIMVIMVIIVASVIIIIVVKQFKPLQHLQPFQLILTITTLQPTSYLFTHLYMAFRFFSPLLVQFCLCLIFNCLFLIQFGLRLIF